MDRSYAAVAAERTSAPQQTMVSDPACVQVEPVVLDHDATIERLAERTAEAAANGATLVVFPEASFV
jgi:hypothetical protein